MQSLLSDPLFRQLIIPLATALLTLLTWLMNRDLAPERIERRVTRSYSNPAPANGNGNGYIAAITAQSRRVDDLREDFVRMEGRLMDKINWLSVGLHEDNEAQDRQIKRLEYMVEQLAPATPTLVHDTHDFGQQLALEARRKIATDQFPKVEPKE